MKHFISIYRFKMFVYVFPFKSRTGEMRLSISACHQGMTAMGVGGSQVWGVSRGGQCERQGDEWAKCEKKQLQIMMGEEHSEFRRPWKVRRN